MTIHEDLVIMLNTMLNLVLNKLVYVGFSVLELSKLLMYEFPYEKILKQFDNINNRRVDDRSEYKTDHQATGW